MVEETSAFSVRPHPELDGWHLWRSHDAVRFNTLLGELAVRCEGEGRVRLRMQPQQQLSNMIGGLHGGALLTFIDVALFVGPLACGDDKALGGVTIDLSTQFAGGADLIRPIDLLLETVRETGRMKFLRGVVEQGDDMIASFIATVRKAR